MIRSLYASGKVVRLVVQGFTNREIAAALSISPDTACTHVGHVLAKLGLRSPVEIAAWRIRRSSSYTDLFAKRQELVSGVECKGMAHAV